MQVLITLQYEFILPCIFPKTLICTPVIQKRRQVEQQRMENKLRNFFIVHLQL